MSQPVTGGGSEIAIEFEFIGAYLRQRTRMVKKVVFTKSLSTVEAHDDGLLSLLTMSTQPNVMKGERDKPTLDGIRIRLVLISPLVTGRPPSVLHRYPSKS